MSDCAFCISGASVLRSAGVQWRCHAFESEIAPTILRQHKTALGMAAGKAGLKHDEVSSGKVISV